MTQIAETGPVHGGGVLTVDLDAIAANYSILAGHAPGCEAAAAVKADGYGLGLGPVARTLWAAGCRSFFVATADEGIALRALLNQATIAVLSGLIAAPLGLFREYRLLPVLNDLGQVATWAQYCRDTGTLPAALHLDTGMARLGLTPAETATLAAEPNRLDGFDLRWIVSHLACADQPEHPLNAVQHDAFAGALARLKPAPASLAASSGIFLGPDWHFDMVRPGAALYGLAPQAGRPNPMRPVVQLQVKILQIRDVDTPQTVGYGAAHRFAVPARVATVAAGYADGCLRSLSGRGTAHIGDIAVPLVGRVSMDLMTLDVTQAPAARPGDMIDLIGPNQDVDALAARAGTIGYEILTALGRRYRRRYLGGGAS